MSNISINGKVTGIAADGPLRERGRKSFLKEIGGEKLKDSPTLKKTMESLQKARQRYRQSMGIVGKNMLLDIKLGRVMKRLEVLFQVGDAAMNAAPEIVSLVWLAFRMIFSGFLKDAATCAVLIDAVDQISDIMFVFSVFENAT